MKYYTFKRGERLKSRKVIAQLFSQGQSFAQYPLRLVWMPMLERQSEYPVQFTVSVPKKKFKKAVQRNPLRRRIRESYRLNKHLLYDQLDNNDQIAFMVLYTAKEELSYEVIDKAMQKMMKRFLKKYRNTQVATNPQ